MEKLKGRYLPAGYLMKEHRLIERLIRIMDDKLPVMEKSNTPDLRFLGTALDFLKTYADKLHHGKEENILFRELKGKRLSEGHQKIMDGLIKDHISGRESVRALEEACYRYGKEGPVSLRDIARHMKILTSLYPGHIETEDKKFFLPCMEYFNSGERDAMLEEFREFDRMMIHGKYGEMVEGIT
jgi:hemerythrin-like domain-containing protein